MNPPHLWHISIIDYSLNYNDTTIVFLWSSNISDKKNPLDFNNRQTLLTSLFDKNIKNKSLNILESNDFKEDIKWAEDISLKLGKFLFTFK